MKKKKVKKSSILVNEIVPNVYAISFLTQYELCMSFVRMQEFYESQEFGGKYFTLEEFIDYWSREFGDGVFDYTRRWNGFNVPGKVLYDWCRLFTLLRPKEAVLVTKLLEKIREYNVKDPKKLKDIYIIGYHRNGKNGNTKEVINHELAHAMCTLYPEYRNACDEILSEMNSTKEGRDLYDHTALRLKVMGYSSNVINDEMQAYWSTSDLYRFGQKDSSRFDKFRNNFKKFSRKLKSEMKKE